MRSFLVRPSVVGTVCCALATGIAIDAYVLRSPTQPTAAAEPVALPRPSPTLNPAPQVRRATMDLQSAPANPFRVSVAAHFYAVAVEPLASDALARHDIAAVISPATHNLRYDRASGTVSGTAAPSTTYTVDFIVDGQRLVGGKINTAPAPVARSTIELKNGAEYGVGIPIRVRFSQNVVDRATVEHLARVESTPAQPGSWGWVSPDTMVWRPNTYWKPGTKVKVTVPLAAQPLSDSHFGTDTQLDFTIGRELIMRIDSNTHHMVVFENGQAKRSLPVSLGKATPQHRTRSGTKVIFAKDERYTMRGPASDPYTVNVQWAQRITNSGEFLHSAPWSVGSQGRANVSHGCTNLSPADSQWLFGLTKIGDVVETVNTGRSWDGIDNGWGGVWNVTPEQWLKYSATPATDASKVTTRAPSSGPPAGNGAKNSIRS